MLLKGKYPCRVVIHHNAAPVPSSPLKGTPASPQKTGKTVDIRTLFGAKPSNGTAAPAPASVVEIDDDDRGLEPADDRQKRFLVDDALSSPASRKPNSVASKPDSDPRPACPYGAKCYRKNPAHFKEYQHPPKDGEPVVAAAFPVQTHVDTAKPPALPKPSQNAGGKKRAYESMVGEHAEPPTPPEDVLKASPSDELEDLPPSASLKWDEPPVSAAVETSASVSAALRKQIAAASQKPEAVGEPVPTKVVRQPTVPYTGPTAPKTGPKPFPQAALHPSGSEVSSASALPTESHVLVMPVLSVGPEFAYPAAEAVNIAVSSILSFCQQRQDANFRICVVELKEDSDVFRELRRSVAEHQALADWCG
jgi:hypothetical protein